MATVLSTLYPPLIGTFQPAFEYNDGPEITFTISNYNSYSKINHIHISLVNQKTNQNAFATNENNAVQVPIGTYLIDGIWIVPFQDDYSGNIFTYFDIENNLYKIRIPNTILKNKSTEFVIDYYYKVQLRFDCVTDEMILSNGDSLNSFNSSYLNKYRSCFSEWSSISLLKAVPRTEIQVTGFSIINSNGLTNANLKNKTPQFSPGVIPITGKLMFFKDGNVINATDAGKEWIKDYQIKVYKEEDDKTKTLILDSDTIYPDAYRFKENNLNLSSKSQSDYWTNNFSYLIDLTDEDADHEYVLDITVHTKNNFTARETFNFKLINALFTPNWVWSFNEKELSYYGTTVNKIVTEEDGEINGTVTIQLGLDQQSLIYRNEPGYMFIRRSDSLSNFKNWTIIKCVACPNPLTPVDFVDKTVGSLIQYKYSAQYLCYRGGVQTPVDKSPTIIYPDFHDILISSGDKQLAIRYNGQIGSMTPTVNRVKIDTLGGRYPKFAENAKLNYKQFNLSGLLVAESDYNRKFLNDLDYLDDMHVYDNTQNGSYIIRNDTVLENFDINHPNGTYTSDISNKTTWIDQEKESTQKNTSHDIYPINNWWWERKFREEAIKWLNNGEPKLFRSMTEGNMIVMIDGISLTPNAQLGRRIWNFSCTVYEIGDGYDLKLLDELGIFNIQNEYNQKNIDFNGKYDDNENDDLNLIGQTITVLNQQYQLKALENNADIVENIIIENINFLYQGLGKNYQYKEDSISLHDLKIDFISPPQYYFLDGNNILNKSDFSENDNDFYEKAELGYKLTLYYKNNKNQSTPIDIFIESKDGSTGYYQIPSNLQISKIILYDGTVVMLNCYLTYELDYHNTEIPDFYSQEETIVGQINDYWSFGTNIGNFINKKYEVYNYNEDDDYKYTEGLIYWRNLKIESDPYSIYEISYKDGITNVIQAGEKNTYIVPRTGNLILPQDSKVANCWAAGKQMFIVKDNDRTPFLDEWECILDKSVTNPYEINDDNDENEYWYLIKNSGEIELDKDINNDYILVKFYKTENNFYLVNNDESAPYLTWDQLNDGILDIYDEWVNLDEIKDSIIENIQKPEYNKIYRIFDHNLIPSYMIYYLNQGWYQINFLDGFTDNEFDPREATVIQAQVPISGMIEYKADVYKQGWEIKNGEENSTLNNSNDNNS